MIIHLSAFKGLGYHWDTDLPGWIRENAGPEAYKCIEHCGHVQIDKETWLKLKEFISEGLSADERFVELNSLLIKMFESP